MSIGELFFLVLALIGSLGAPATAKVNSALCL